MGKSPQVVVDFFESNTPSSNTHDVSTTSSMSIPMLIATTKIIIRLITNAQTKSEDEKFRRVRLGNAKIQQAVVEPVGAMNILLHAGFTKIDVDGESILIYDIESINEADDIVQDLQTRLDVLHKQQQQQSQSSTTSTTTTADNSNNNNPFLSEEECKKRREEAKLKRKAKKQEKILALQKFQQDKEDRDEIAARNTAAKQVALKTGTGGYAPGRDISIKRHRKEEDSSSPSVSTPSAAAAASTTSPLATSSSPPTIAATNSTALQYREIHRRRQQQKDSLASRASASAAASASAKDDNDDDKDDDAMVVTAEDAADEVENNNTNNEDIEDDDRKMAAVPDDEEAVDEGMAVSIEDTMKAGNSNNDEDSGALSYLDKIPRCASAEGIRETSIYSRKTDTSGSSGNSPQCLRVLLRELDKMKGGLPSDPRCPIWVRFDEETPQFVRAVIGAALPGPTPYSGGLFCFDIYIPRDYPSQPPNVTLLTTGGGSVRFGPNLYADGKVCLSLLGTWPGPKWVPGLSNLTQVLISIQGMLLG